MPSAKNGNVTNNEEQVGSEKTTRTATKKRPVRKTAAKKAGKAKSASKQPVVAAEPETAVARPVVLDIRLNIETVASLTDQLVRALSAEGSIAIDATKVESIDSAALQVLVAFTNSARAHSLAVEWQGDTSALREFSELADLDRYLDLGVAPVEEPDDGLCPVF